MFRKMQKLTLENTHQTSQSVSPNTIKFCLSAKLFPTGISQGQDNCRLFSIILMYCIESRLSGISYTMLLLCPACYFENSELTDSNWRLGKERGSSESKIREKC